MKIKLILGFLLLTASFVTAQQQSSPCAHIYEARFEKSTDAARPYVAVLHYDFSKIDRQANQVKVEILPIEDCYNAEKGAIFKPVVAFEFKSNDPSKGQLDLDHLQIRVKCFKWRTLINDSCSSEWNYYSFL